MTEHRLFDGGIPYVSTAQFHADRERARHLEHPVHRPRLLAAAALVRVAAQLSRGPVTVSDLGCGDGGLLSLLADLEAWGYDFCPANAMGWAERGIKAEQLDVFGADRDRVRFGTVAVVTEVFEHLADPHAAVAWIAGRSPYLVASSPWNESPQFHDECHAWCWDENGYRALVESAGYRVLRHQRVMQFQLVLGWRP